MAVSSATTVTVDLYDSYVLQNTVVLSVAHQTCDSQVLGLSHGLVPLHYGFRKATYTCVPLSPSNITWYWPKGSDAVWLGR